MLNIPLLAAAGFTDESFNTGKCFMLRILENVGNLTIHSKAYVSCFDGETVTAWLGVNVYITEGTQHLCEYVTPKDKQTFTSTEEALSALGFDADRFRQSA